MKSEIEVAQSFPTLSDPMDCSPPGSSVHRISQARVLEWGATAFSYNTLNVPVPKWTNLCPHCDLQSLLACPHFIEEDLEGPRG